MLSSRRKKILGTPKHWVWWVTTWLSNSNLFIYPLDVFFTHFYQKHNFRICLKQRDFEWSFWCSVSVWSPPLASHPVTPGEPLCRDPQEFNAPAIKICVQSLWQLRQMKHRDCKLLSRQNKQVLWLNVTKHDPNFPLLVPRHSRGKESASQAQMMTAWYATPVASADDITGYLVQLDKTWGRHDQMNLNRTGFKSKRFAGFADHRRQWM